MCSLLAFLPLRLFKTLCAIRYWLGYVESSFQAIAHRGKKPSWHFWLVLLCSPKQQGLWVGQSVCTKLEGSTPDRL